MSETKTEENKTKETKGKYKAKSKNKSKPKDKTKANQNEKIPNSLIIYIKTRIPNFYKLNYEPFMTVPKNKSHTVYFDPLVKYYETPIKNIPRVAPKDTLYTQFFEASEFDSMINRILSDFRYMQKPRTLQESVEQHVIENNINITLQNLFKPNGLFYINGNPYTIIGSKWNSSDWQIDKKPIEKLLSQFSHLSPQELEKQAIEEEDDIPEILRQGNLASGNLSNEAKSTAVAAGLEKAASKVSNKATIKEMSGKTDAFINQDNLPGVSEDIKRLYSEYLRKNIPINYSDVPDMARDPLTLSLLIDPAELLQFINQNKKSNIIDLYSAYIASKTSLQEADKEYTDSCTELAIFKTTFSKRIKDIRDMINKFKDDKKNPTEMIQEIYQLKITYMKFLFRIADSIMQIYTLQNTYFICTRALIEELKKDYVNIIKYYEKPELALKCVDYDIAVLNSLAELDPENPYSVSYFSNYERFKEFYNNNLYKNQQTLLTPQINYADEAEIYMNEPGVLFIEKHQYEIYDFKLFLFYSYNQFDIWVLLFKSIELFSRFIGTETTSIIDNSENSMQKFNKAFPAAQQKSYEEKLDYSGIRATYDATSKNVNWYLVKSDGSKAINTTNTASKKTEDKMYERLYIDTVKTQVQTYDAVILYIYLLEIQCLRQNRVYVAEENVNQLNLEYSLTLNEYYYTIKESIKDNLGSDIFIPKSFLWDTSNLNNMNYLSERKESNDKSYIIYRGRIKAIQESRNNLVVTCEEIARSIAPNISKKGFIEKCDKLLASNLSDVSKYTFRSSYWLQQTINKYDIQTTNDFIFNINKVVKDAWHDRIIDNIEPEYYLDWMVYDNDATNTADSLYAAVADGLNGELDYAGNETTNKYTEEINGKKRFTISSLKQMVKDIDPTIESELDARLDARLELNINKIINILENTLKIKFIVYELIKSLDNNMFLGDIVIYKNEFPCRVIDKENKNGQILYTLFNGYYLINDVPETEIRLSENNLGSNFGISCVSESKANMNIVFEDFMYLVVSKKNNASSNEFYKYELVKNSSQESYVLLIDQIPIYIKYLIFNNCIRFNRPSQIIDSGLEVMKPSFDNFNQQIQDQIATNTVKLDLKRVRDDIKNYASQYKKLKSIKGKTLEQQAEQVLLKEEIKDLHIKKTQLKNLINPNKKNVPEFVSANPIGSARMIGGINPRRFRDEYAYQNQPYYNQSYYNQPYYNQPYYNPLGYQPMPNNSFYFPSRNQYPIQNRLPYNVSQNKAKDTKSKLSFYVTLELELFPGTSANAFQKSVVRCQSSFERIREAYSDLFGFQYRPAPMNEAYPYISQKPKTDNDTRKNIKQIRKNNKSQKYRK